MFKKNKTLAAVFALTLGWAGVHKFYLGDARTGIFYIMLMVMGSAFRFPISAMLGIFDFFRLITMGQNEFDRRYNRELMVQRRSRGPVLQRDVYPRQKQKVQPVSKPAKQNKFRSKVNPYKKTAFKRYEEFDTEEAIKEFKKALEIEPNNKDYLFKLACAYSQLEKSEEAIKYLDAAIRNGFKDVEKINTIEDLAYLRISPSFKEFKQNGYSLKTAPRLEAPKENLLDNDLVLSQLNKLVELRKRGLLSDVEFAKEKSKLLNR